ncbi:uncharacterized protein LOC110961245 isoform X4 [Acanthochromis polyacanthus]|uniref:uncharacterized protein LOC110961245 isoform X4 n=1 Tax=Acanthochromis polyacanthus TaxID=80966 RepID=UPI002234E5D9|nr:uncharacterized protein LOC110961245 isoform X4 [Acanthochromis polyacanthus]
MGHGAMGGTAGRRGGSQGGTLTGGVPTALIQHATGMDSNACVIGLCWVMILINTRTSRRPQVNSVWIHQPHRWKNTDALPPSSTSLLVSDQFPVSNMQGMSWVPVEVLLTTGGTPKPNIHNTEPTAVKVVMSSVWEEGEGTVLAVTVMVKRHLYMKSELFIFQCHVDRSVLCMV